MKASASPQSDSQVVVRANVPMEHEATRTALASSAYMPTTIHTPASDFIETAATTETPSKVASIVAIPSNKTKKGTSKNKRPCSACQRSKRRVSRLCISNRGDLFLMEYLKCKPVEGCKGLCVRCQRMGRKCPPHMPFSEAKKVYEWCAC